MISFCYFKLGDSLAAKNPSTGEVLFFLTGGILSGRGGCPDQKITVS
jgi:hypothetical protein